MVVAVGRMMLPGISFHHERRQRPRYAAHPKESPLRRFEIEPRLQEMVRPGYSISAEMRR
jgi:hypothetical protein